MGIWSLLRICFFLPSLIIGALTKLCSQCANLFSLFPGHGCGDRRIGGFPVSRHVHVTFCTFSVGMFIRKPCSVGLFRQKEVVKTAPDTHDLIFPGLLISSSSSLTLLIFVAVVLKFGYHWVNYLIDYIDHATLTPDHFYLLVGSSPVTHESVLDFAPGFSE